jgi:dienelactone hydrolase
VDSVPDIQIAGRDRTIDVRVTYPEGNGPFPVIVFSHGSGASKEEYQPLVRAWASAGYVVLQPNHADAHVNRNKQDRSKVPTSRAQDISALIDHLDDVESKVPSLHGKLDRQHIGIGGHSFGGQTVQLIGGYRMGGTENLRDDRVIAAVLLAPPGAGATDTPASWSNMRLPMLTIVGAHDTGRGGQSPLWRTDAFQNATAPDDYLIVVDRAEHLLGGISEKRSDGQPVPQSPDDLHLVFAATTAFWNAYLKDDGTACNTFASGQVVAQSPTAARFISKSGVRVRSASASDQVEVASVTESFVQKYDLDDDGRLSRDEAPARLPDNAFAKLDRDGDGYLSEDEAKALAERSAQMGGGGGGRKRGGGGAGNRGATTSGASEQLPAITQTQASGTATCHVSK